MTRISNLERKEGEGSIYSLQEKEALYAGCIVALKCALFVCLDGGLCRYQLLMRYGGVDNHDSQSIDHDITRGFVEERMSDRRVLYTHVPPREGGWMTDEKDKWGRWEKEKKREPYKHTHTTTTAGNVTSISIFN